MQQQDTLRVIRPCRESATGWSRQAQAPSGNHSSLALNERGPALNVFWSRQWRDGRRQVKGNSEAPPTNALDQLAARRYSEGAYKRAGGAWPLRPPFRFNMDELRSLATLR
jgi:hypothetical protein